MATIFNLMEPHIASTCLIEWTEFVAEQVMMKAKGKPKQRRGLWGAVLMRLLTLVVVSLGLVWILYANKESPHSDMMPLSLPDTSFPIIPELTRTNATRYWDMTFAPDSKGLYVVDEGHLYQFQLSDTGWTLHRIELMPSDYQASTVAVHPEGNPIAVGTTTTVDAFYTTPRVLFYHTDRDGRIKEWESGQSYNHGGSMQLAYSSDGSELWHLYNLNNAGCGRTSNHLQMLDTQTGITNTYQLPSPHIRDFVLGHEQFVMSLNDLCLHDSTELRVDTGQGSPMTLLTAGGGRFAYLTQSQDGTMLAVRHEELAPLFENTLYVWKNLTLAHEIRLVHEVDALAITPDNQYLVFGVTRDDKTDIELHVFNVVENRHEFFIQTDFDMPIDHLAISSNGQWLSAIADNQLSVWSLNS